MDSIRVRVTISVPMPLIIDGVSPGKERHHVKKLLGAILSQYGITVILVWFEARALPTLRKKYLEEIHGPGHEEEVA